MPVGMVLGTRRAGDIPRGSPAFFCAADSKFHFRLMVTMAQSNKMNQGSRNSPTHVQTSHLESSIVREAFRGWGQDDSVVSYFRCTRNSDWLAGF